MKHKRRMLVLKGYYCSGMESNSGKIEVIPFVVKSSSNLTIVNLEITIQVLLDMVLLTTETRLFTKDITDLTHSESVSTSSSAFLAQRRAYSLTESKINMEFCFQVKSSSPCI